MRLSPLILPVVFLIGATVSFGQAVPAQDSVLYCDSLCWLPSLDALSTQDVSYECPCLSGGEASSSSGHKALTPQEIMQRVREDYVRQYGDVQNYTVVQTSSTVPMPFVMYYERDDAPAPGGSADSSFAAEPMIRFRLVPESELSERESKVDAEETGKEMGSTLGKLFGGLAKGKKTPKQAGTEAAADAMSEYLKNMGKTIAQPGYQFKAQSLVDSLFWNPDLIDKMKVAYQSASLVNDGPPTVEGYQRKTEVQTTVLRADSPDIDLADFDPEMAAEGYKITTIVLEIANDPGDASFFPIRMLTHIETPAGNRLQLRREYSDYRLEGGKFVPRQTSYTMDGIAALVKGAHEFNTYTEIYSILDIMFNRGMPTAEERQQMIVRAMKTMEATMKAAQANAKTKQ